MLDINKLRVRQRKTKMHFTQEVCPVCGNWYHEGEVRAAVDYCCFCNGSYAGAAVTTKDCETLYRTYAAKDILSVEDIEFLDLLSDKLTGYWESEFGALVRHARKRNA